jgi:hypothetical protein
MSEQQPSTAQRTNILQPPDCKISRQPEPGRPWPAHAAVNNRANFLGNQRPATAEVPGG